MEFKDIFNYFNSNLKNKNKKYNKINYYLFNIEYNLIEFIIW